MLRDFLIFDKFRDERFIKCRRAVILSYDSRTNQNEARFGPFNTSIGPLKSISRDLSNGTLYNFGSFGDSETLEGLK